MTFPIVVLCFVTFQHYVADLTATMTAEEPTVDIRSFQDILDYDYQARLQLSIPSCF